MAMASLLRRRHPALPLARPPLPLRLFSALPDPAPLPSRPPTPSERSASVRDLLRALGSAKDPDRIHSLVVSSLAAIPGLHSSRPALSLAVSRLARLRRPDLAASVVSHLLSHPDSPRSGGLLARAISLLSLASLPDAALAAFREAPASARSDMSLSALLSALLRAGRLAEVKSTFAGAAAELGVAPGLASHSVLLHALVKNDELAAARKLLDEMASQAGGRPSPDIVSYNTVLAGFLEKGDDEGFEALLKEINARGLEHNVVSYYTRINWFVKRGESFRGEELLDAMEKKGIVLTSLIRNALVIGYCREGNAGSAMRVFKRVKGPERRDPKTLDTYGMLLRLLVEEGRFDDALGVCKSCLAMKAAPPFPPVKGLVDGLVKESRVAEAKDVVAKMNVVVHGDAKAAWEKLIGKLSLREDTAGSSP